MCMSVFGKLQIWQISSPKLIHLTNLRLSCKVMGGGAAAVLSGGEGPIKLNILHLEKLEFPRNGYRRRQSGLF